MTDESKTVESLNLKERFDMDGDGDVDAQDVKIVGAGVIKWAKANPTSAMKLAGGVVVLVVVGAISGDAGNILSLFMG